MTDQLFLDTDCLSSYLMVGKENILLQLYRNRIVLPEQGLTEIVRVPFLKIKMRSLVSSGQIQVVKIIYNTPEAKLFYKLTVSPDAGFKIIGDGEAAAITLAKFNNGILGCNNMSDIVPYVKEFGLRHVTSSDIMVEAYKCGMISEQEGNVIWGAMRSRGRLLPAVSFSEFLINY